MAKIIQEAACKYINISQVAWIDLEILCISQFNNNIKSALTLIDTVVVGFLFTFSTKLSTH